MFCIQDKSLIRGCLTAKIKDCEKYMQYLLVAIFFVSSPKIHPQNDVEGGLKNPPYLCATSGKKKYIDNICPPYDFLGERSDTKKSPQNDVER